LAPINRSPIIKHDGLLDKYIAIVSSRLGARRFQTIGRPRIGVRAAIDAQPGHLQTHPGRRRGKPTSRTAKWPARAGCRPAAVGDAQPAGVGSRNQHGHGHGGLMGSDEHSLSLHRPGVAGESGGRLEGVWGGAASSSARRPIRCFNGWMRNWPPPARASAAGGQRLSVRR